MENDTKVSTSAILVSARENVVKTLPYASFYTLPILTIRNQTPLLIVYVGRGEFVNPEAGYCIWKPHMAVTYSAVTGFLEELKGIGNPTANDPPIGKGISPIDKLDAAYLEKQVRYCELNDKLIQALDGSTDCQELKIKVKEAFLEGCEQVLHNYFNKLFIR